MIFFSLARETAAEVIDCLGWWKKYGAGMPHLAAGPTSPHGYLSPGGAALIPAGLAMTAFCNCLGDAGEAQIITSAADCADCSGVNIDPLLLRDAAELKAKKARVHNSAGASASSRAGASASSSSAATVQVDEDEGEEELVVWEDAAHNAEALSSPPSSPSWTPCLPSSTASTTT